MVEFYLFNFHDELWQIYIYASYIGCKISYTSSIKLALIHCQLTKFGCMFMQYFVHLPSNIIFRSKNEVVNFLLYGEHPPKQDTSKKRKQCNVYYLQQYSSNELILFYFLVILEEAIDGVNPQVYGLPK